MIERLDSLPSLPKTVSAARIKALCSTYCNTVGIDLFRQTANGLTTAYFGGISGSFSLEAEDNADFGELSAYFRFLGASVFCNGATAVRLDCRRRTASGLYELKAEADATLNDGHGSIAEIYEKLQNGLDGDIVLPPFDDWYTDFCARFNHGAAEYSETPTAVAVTGFMTESISLITGVAVAADHRKTGEGSAVLRTLIHNIRKKYPQSRIFAAANAAAGFYIKNGFSHVGNVAVCEF